MHIRFVVCGELTIPHLGLIYYCFYKRKIAMRNLGKPSRSDFVQSILCVATHNMLNYHATFTHGTIEFRLFQFDAPANGKQNGLHAGQLKSYIQLCLALSQMAKEVRTASPKEQQKENPKYAMRTWLLRLGFIGDEFKTAREILTKRLAGDTAFRNGRVA